MEHSPSLERLATQAAAGERAAFEALVEATHATLYRVALRTLGNAADAEDVVQDTYIRAYGSLGTLKDAGAVMGWLCSVARNVATDKARSRGRRVMVSLDSTRDEDAAPLVNALADEGPHAEARLSSAQAGKLLTDALAELKEKHRVILTLREIDGLSYEEIAAALGLSMGTVESRIHRAREALTRKFKRAAQELGE